MIIVINSQGAVVSQQTDDLFQGSHNIGVINLIAPFASNVVFKAMFELPDGSYSPKNLDGVILTPSIEIIEGLNTWRLLVNFPITQYSGIVKMQLRGMIGDEVICTTTVKFKVQEGIPYDNEYVEPSTYDYILGLIADLRAVVNDKVNISNYKYEPVSVDADTVGVYYVLSAETGKYEQKILPSEYQSNVQYYDVSVESFIGNNNQGLYFGIIDRLANQEMRFELKGDKATINGKTVATLDDLVAKNIAYDNANSGMNSQDVNSAIDELKFQVNSIEPTQVLSLGNKKISASGWVADGNVWKYEFTDEMFANALVQELIMTPDNTAIQNLNDNDILIYPQVTAYQQSPTVAVGVIKADKKPEFDMMFDVKLQGTAINISTEGILAGQIVFVPTDKIAKNNVQEAITQVQTNLDDLKTQYESEKTGFATLDESGKITANQLPSYVDDVVECYTIEGVAPMTAGWLTQTQGSTALTPLSGKIYIVISEGEYQNKQYRWGGSHYALISESLALGETSSTAYAGNKGKANAEAISVLDTTLQNILNGTSVVPASQNATNATNDDLGRKISETYSTARPVEIQRGSNTTYPNDYVYPITKSGLYAIDLLNSASIHFSALISIQNLENDVDGGRIMVSSNGTVSINFVSTSDMKFILITRTAGTDEDWSVSSCKLVIAYE